LSIIEEYASNNEVLVLTENYSNSFINKGLGADINFSTINEIKELDLNKIIKKYSEI